MPIFDSNFESKWREVFLSPLCVSRRQVDVESAHVNMKLSLKNALPYISRNADIVRALDLSRSQIPLEEAAELEKVK